VDNNAGQLRAQTIAADYKKQRDTDHYGVQMLKAAERFAITARYTMLHTTNDEIKQQLQGMLEGMLIALVVGGYSSNTSHLVELLRGQELPILYQR
jgi:hypothetical protein